MKLSLIAAMADNRVIGLNGQMPWHLPADLKRFKQITLGSPILMGRKTFESIGKPLAGRLNIVISRNPGYKPADCLTFSDLSSAIEYCRDYAEVFIIGGAALYQSAFIAAERLYLTEIHQDFNGDTCFPEFDRQLWQEIDRRDIQHDESVDFSYSFVMLERVTEGKRACT